jgi:transcriptional regulator with XRE-family HTH domain
MIDEKVELKTDRPVFEQIIKVHQLTYKQLAKELKITDGALRKVRSGDRGFKMTMSQVKTLSKLLKPFDIRLEDLPEDWMVEKKEIVTK